MARLPKEVDLEKHIVEYLCSQPIFTFAGELLVDEQREQMYEYHQVEPAEYDRKLCLVRSELLLFIKQTQQDEWNKLVENAGGEQDAEKALFNRLDNELSKYGTLDVLKPKSGTFDVLGAHFRLVFFKPVSNKNLEQEQWYHRNRLGVMRQFKYSTKKGNEDLAIDLLILVNGLPVLTIELKNTLTGQKHENAIKQYMQDRKTEGEKSLEFKRILVHFACGTEQIYMTTRLAGGKTRFFPFNKYFENRPPEGIEDTYEAVRSEYLWKDVLRKDSLLNLLQNYLLVQENEEEEYDKKKGDYVKTKSYALIFPRYHQRRAVERLIGAQRTDGVGHRYLIEHSAGSGKSNTITWLAFRLSNFFQHVDDMKPMFDTVFVVTDRLALNSQIANNIRQFQMVEGTVVYVGENDTAEKLRTAIDGHKRIIVTNIQKFPVIAEMVQHDENRNYAVIIDEAHSSQTGNMARQMRKALSLAEAEDFDKPLGDNEEFADNPQAYLTDEDMLNKAIELSMSQTGVKKNVSFFAFTATPKAKTIELFCERENGTKEPFDVYSMMQAIQEGFIMDVLENYMSFSRYYKLLRLNGKEDLEYEKKKTSRLLASFVDLHDAAIEKKSRIMLEHFANNTAKEINGEARAMLVTRSRLHAVKYKQKFDEIMQEMHLPYKALVAFSGTVKDADTGMEYTENSMNMLADGVSIPRAFKNPKYRILIVAMKYQTGFDEPKLHTMYVDKKLGDTSTVQTLSRLNRTCKGKTSTMVLDFVNNPEDIQKDFQKYYGRNFMNEEDETNPDTLYLLQSELYHYNVFSKDDVREFAKFYFTEDRDKLKINKVIDKVCDTILNKYKDDEDTRIIIRKRCRRFSNLYYFLSQIITFKDGDLEQLAPFCYAVYEKLPYQERHIPYDVLEKVRLHSYKLKYLGKSNIALSDGDTALVGQTAGHDSGAAQDEMDLLSNIIKMLNDTYGLDLSETDKIELEQMRQNILHDEELMTFFNSDNARNDVQKMFEDRVDDELLNFINSKIDLYNKLSENRANSMFKSMFFNELYDLRVRGI